MQRETKEVVTSSGKKIVLKTYLSGREVTEVMKARGDKSDLQVAEELIKQAVVSVEGKSENALETLLDLPINEYLEISKAVNELAGASFPKAK